MAAWRQWKIQLYGVCVTTVIEAPGPDKEIIVTCSYDATEDENPVLGLSVWKKWGWCWCYKWWPLISEHEEGVGVPEFTVFGLVAAIVIIGVFYYKKKK